MSFKLAHEKKKHVLEGLKCLNKELLVALANKLLLFKVVFIEKVVFYLKVFVLR